MQTPDFGPGGSNAPIPPPYGTPGIGPGPGGTRSVNGTLLLIMGIFGILCCNILGPITWALSNSAMATINSGEGLESERGQVSTARILGMVGTGVMALGLLWFLFAGLTFLSTARQISASGSTSPPTFQPAPPIPPAPPSPQ
jgi:hypothetical protein